jgi:hypothetical protein
MANPANSTVQNLLPVQAYFSVDGQFQTFIGQGQPFTATIDPDQSGLNITNSTINSTTIGATTPSTGVFSSGQVLATPSGSTDIANKLYVDSVASGLSWKQPFQVATTINLASRSGFPIIDTYQTVAGDRILVKNQTNAAENGIYVASSGTWAYATDGDNWNEYISAIGFVEYGSQLGSAWYCSAQSGGTLGVTNMVWSNFSVAGTYFAGTGLTLSAYTFSITNTGVTAATYGSASSVPVVAVNAQGQITSATNTTIAIANTQVSGLGTMSTQNANSVAITGGTIDGTAVGATTAAAVTGTTITAGTQFTGPGTGLTGTASSLNIGGSAGSATTATNLAGGAAGSVPYQSAAGTTALLAAGSNGQVLTLASGVPSWATPTTGTVTSVSGTGTVNGLTLTGTVTSSGSLTLGGTLDLSAPPAIGGTTANTVRGTTVTATTGFVGTNYDASGSGGGSLRTNTGTACLQWGGGGGTNVTIDGAINMNGANSAIQINPTGTGTVSIAPAGALTVNPTTASTMNNVAIGGTTPLAGSFTDLSVTGTTSFDGSQGTAGQVLTSAGTGATPTWTTISAGLTVTDDTTTNATRYLTFTSATSGTISGINTASTELTWNPGTGIFSLAGSTGGFNMPIGTTAQRPSTTTAGHGLRYNTTTGFPEIYTDSGWRKIVPAAYDYVITYAIVAGGGGGGTGAPGGGGGAGGYLSATNFTLNPGTTYSFVVGAGGGSATNGSDSTAFSLTAIGGGAGRSGGGSSGGSGGGAGTGGSGGAGTSGQGNAGGGNTSQGGGGGGGGASAVGGSGSGNSPGGGGNGTTFSPNSTTYAGGGGGGGYYNSTGGTGGGGNGGGLPGNDNATSGTANTGGGGGGSGSAYGGGSPGSGGSGTVILSIPTVSYTGTVTGSPTVTTSGSNTIVRYTSSGSYTA